MKRFFTPKQSSSTEHLLQETYKSYNTIKTIDDTKCEYCRRYEDFIKSQEKQNKNGEGRI